MKQQPPRLVARTMGVTFVTVAVILSVVFTCSWWTRATACAQRDSQARCQGQRLSLRGAAPAIMAIRSLARRESRRSRPRSTPTIGARGVARAPRRHAGHGGARARSPRGSSITDVAVLDPSGACLAAGSGAMAREASRSLSARCRVISAALPSCPAACSARPPPLRLEATMWARWSSATALDGRYARGLAGLPAPAS